MFRKSNPYLDVLLPALLLLLLLQLLVEDPLLDLLQLVPGEVTEDLLQLTDRDRNGGLFPANGQQPSSAGLKKLFCSLARWLPTV